MSQFLNTALIYCLFKQLPLATSPVLSSSIEMSVVLDHSVSSTTTDNSTFPTNMGHSSSSEPTMPTMPTMPTTSTMPSTPPGSSQFTFSYTLWSMFTLLSSCSVCSCLLSRDHDYSSCGLVVGVIAALIVGTCILICIDFLYGRVSWDQVCTHIHVH